jgi:hypothetical protein
MRIAIALCLVAVTTAAAYAGEGPRHELSLGSSTRALRSSSANAVTADSLGGGSVGYAHALDLDIFPRLALWLEGSFGWGGVDGVMFQTLTTEVDAIAFTAGGRARYTLHRNVHASARLELGTARARLAIRDDQGHTATDKGWGVTSSAGLGLELLAVARPRFSLGLRAELGYVATSAVSLVATPEGERNNTLQLEMTAAGLGSLDLSGPAFGASVVSQF